MNFIAWSDLPTILPALALIVGALVVVGVDVLVRRDDRAAMAELLSAATLVVSLVLIVLGVYRPEDVREGFAGAVTQDRLSLFLSMAIVLAAGLTQVLSGGLIRKQGMPPAEYSALLLIAAGGMMLLVQALDLVTFFIALEILSLCLYVLAGVLRRDARSNEASLKYFLMGAFATGFLLYGMALLYGATGTVKIPEIGRVLEEQPGGQLTLATIGFCMLAVGVCFKVGAVPFHMWVPDVYEGSPTPVTAFMSVAVKAAGFGAFLRILLMAGAPQAKVWGELLYGVAVATMVVGNLLAVWQRNVKRMLAYSSIAHSGYLLAGLAVLRGPDGREEAAAGTLFYLFAYTFMTLGAFAFVICAGRGGKDAEDLDDYAGLAKRRPWLALAMTVFLVSLSGIPPTAGFFGKFLIFKAAMEAGDWLLVVVGVLGSAVSVYYYLRVAVTMYMMPEGTPSEEKPSTAVSVVVLAAALFTMLLGLQPTTYLALARRAIEGL